MAFFCECDANRFCKPLTNPVLGVRSFAKRSSQISDYMTATFAGVGHARTGKEADAASVRHLVDHAVRVSAAADTPWAEMVRGKADRADAARHGCGTACPVSRRRQPRDLAGGDCARGSAGNLGAVLPWVRTLLDGGLHQAGPVLSHQTVPTRDFSMTGTSVIASLTLLAAASAIIFGSNRVGKYPHAFQFETALRPTFNLAAAAESEP